MHIELCSRLDTTRVKHEGRHTIWRLINPFVLKINGEVFIVPAGFEFDGASIPRFLWWLFPPTYAPAWEASVFHDYCYECLYKNGITKEWADEAFKCIMLANGASDFVAGRFYWAVSSFGKGGWQG